MKRIDLVDCNVTCLSEVELHETNGGLIPLVAYIVFGIWSFIVGGAIALAD